MVLAAASVLGSPALAMAQQLPQAIGADESSADGANEAEAPLPWRGSTFTWNQAATTTLLGVGRDNIGSENEQYNWWFSFRPRYFLVDAPKDNVRVVLREVPATHWAAGDVTIEERRG